MKKMSVSIADFQYEMKVSGYLIFDCIVPEEMLKRIRADIPKHQEICRYWQQKNGLVAGMEGSAHHVIGDGDSLDEFLYSFFLDEHIRAYFEGEYILNSYGIVNNLPYSDNSYKHAQRFHRDVRTYSEGFRLMLNMLVMVDEFTVENGATKVVPGTHRVKERPSDEYLEKNVVRATGGAGRASSCLIPIFGILQHRILQVSLGWL